MSMSRTQIYLSKELRRRVDDRASAEGKPMAEVVREALEHHLEPEEDVEVALEATFGSVPDASVPSRDEWDRL